MSVFKRRGFSAHKEEETKREKERARRQGKIFRMFLKDGDEDVPVIFLTEEPILFHEHSIKSGKGWDNITCSGDNCPECDRGDNPSYKGAWLVVDRRTFEVDEYKDNKKTGNKKKVKDRVKLLVRGSSDIGKYARKSQRKGLTKYLWLMSKTGKQATTSYELENDKKIRLTEKEIKQLLAQLPEEVRNHFDGEMESLYEIVESQIFDDVELEGQDTGRDDEDGEEDDDEDDDDLGSTMSLDDEEDDDDDEEDEDEDEDEEEEERPRRKIGSKSKSSKAPAKKTVASKKKKSVFKRK
ncbi:single strand DNA binding protein [Bacillus phage BCD7]|uniref:Uncharacterized protein n=1 Tax=Bacillus phage BCD7 TaxID=1136534 RepID=J9PTY5_9CAUD|nr:single strand DNA binding protein [Bacillus phage BCD7]AEZ50503.1 hypothetical protein BCD7_0056 [Bacillus phage BCD7]